MTTLVAAPPSQKPFSLPFMGRWEGAELRLSRIYSGGGIHYILTRRTKFPARRGSDHRVCLCLQCIDRPPGETSRRDRRHHQAEPRLRRLWLPRSMRPMRQGADQPAARRVLRAAGAARLGLTTRPLVSCLALGGRSSRTRPRGHPRCATPR
jgi:hypothetical protein